MVAAPTIKAAVVAKDTITVWAPLVPALRQQTFNAALVNHLNTTCTGGALHKHCATCMRVLPGKSLQFTVTVYSAW